MDIGQEIALREQIAVGHNNSSAESKRRASGDCGEVIPCEDPYSESYFFFKDFLNLSIPRAGDGRVIQERERHKPTPC